MQRADCLVENQYRHGDAHDGIQGNNEAGLSRIDVVHTNGIERIGCEADQGHDQKKQHIVRFPIKGDDVLDADKEKHGKSQKIAPGIDGPTRIIVVELAGENGVKCAQQAAQQADDNTEDHRGNSENIKIGLGGNGTEICEVDNANATAEDQRRGNDFHGGEFFFQQKAA